MLIKNPTSTNLKLAPLVAKNETFDLYQLQRLLKHENWVELHAYQESIIKKILLYKKVIFSTRGANFKIVDAGFLISMQFHPIFMFEPSL